jgi:hypothetical protein
MYILFWLVKKIKKETNLHVRKIWAKNEVLILFLNTNI